MSRPRDEDRQRQRFQPADDDRSRYGAHERTEHDRQSLPDEARDSNRSSRSGRNEREADWNRSWNPAHHEHLDARPVSYQDLGGQSSSKRYRDLDPYQDLNLGNRNSGDTSAWDDRESRNQGFGGNYPTSSYGSQFSGGRHTSLNGNANRNSYGNAAQASYGRDDQGNFGSYSSSQNLGSTGNQGGRYGQSQGSQGYSPTHYGTQHSGSDFGQHYGTEQTLHGNDGFTSNESGLGPKGYRRSDQRIREDVCDLLTSHPEIDPSEVEIQVSRSEITLSGTVGNRQEKRLIEDLVSSVSGVSEVNNQLRVSDVKGSSKSQESISESMNSGHSHQSRSDQGSQASPSHLG